MRLGCPLSIIIIDREEEKTTPYPRVWFRSTTENFELLVCTKYDMVWYGRLPVDWIIVHWDSVSV